MASELSDRLEAIFPAGGGFGEPHNTFILGGSYSFPILGAPLVVTRFIFQDSWVRAETREARGAIDFHAPCPHEAMVFGGGEIIVRSYDWLLSAIYLAESVRELDPLWRACALENEAEAIDTLQESEPNVVQDALMWFAPLRPNLALKLAG